MTYKSIPLHRIRYVCAFFPLLTERVIALGHWRSTMRVVKAGVRRTSPDPAKEKSKIQLCLSKWPRPAVVMVVTTVPPCMQESKAGPGLGLID